MPSSPPLDRRRWMSVLACAAAADIAEIWRKLPAAPAYDFLRRPESGLTMVRGRIGGDGAPFNLGEMTVTRCSVRLADGIIGHAWVQGRDRDHSERAAVLDALMQDDDRRRRIEPEINRLAELAGQRKRRAAKKAAATKVEFFTMVRGED